jgi:hypothetical protein
MNKPTTFDHCSAKDIYEWLIRTAIWHDEYNLRDFYAENHQRIIQLNKFYEHIEDFEKCFWITEMYETNFLRIKKTTNMNSNNFQSIDELNKDKFKKILLNIIYHSKEFFNDRFKLVTKEELDNLIQFFENKKDFEKCYWLNEIKNHFEFECMMNICRSMPD